MDKNSAVITTKEMLGEIIKWFREKELLIQVEDLDTNDMIDMNMPVEDADCMLPLEDVAYKSAKIVFKKSIKEIDEDFFGPKSGINWGVDTVKEFVDTYEVARFTQIEDKVAIVTCDDIYDFGCMIDFFKSQYEITEKIKILD